MRPVVKQRAPSTLNFAPARTKASNGLLSKPWHEEDKAQVHRQKANPLKNSNDFKSSQGSPLGHDFSRIRVKSKSLVDYQNNLYASCSESPRKSLFGGVCHTRPVPIRIQTKKKISRPGDYCENEADRVAEMVMKTSAPQVLQEKSSDAGLQRSASNSSPIIAPPIVYEVLRSSGQPLDTEARSFMESRFGYDFNQVRVHTDSKAAQSAQSLRARAYTAGSNIVFGYRQYAPQTDVGRKLLAHELTHVVQQKPCVMRSPDGECLRGYAEGMGVVLNDLYFMIGTWQETDTDVRLWSERVVEAWITWRYGRALPQAARASILRILFADGVRWIGESPVAGCQHLVIATRRDIAAVTRLVRRIPGAEAAERREAEAGFPSTTDVATDAMTGAEARPGNVQAEAEQERRTERRVAAQPVPRSGSEFEGGRSRTANQPELPAQITGPTTQPTGGTGTYRMQLDYSIAWPDLLSQVAEAMNWVNYHWERYDITELVRQGLSEQAVAQRRHRAVSEEAEVGRMLATERRARMAVEELAEETETSVNVLLDPTGTALSGDPTEVVTNVIAAQANLELLPASAIISLGGISLGALADLMGGEFQEREIPWPRREGFYLVRCIAQPSPQGESGEFRRAASVATKVVEIRHARRLAREAIDLPHAQIAEKELALEAARRRQPPDEARIRELGRELQNMRRATTGSAIEAIDVAIARTEAARDQATGRRRDQLQRQLDSLREQRERAVQRQQAFTGSVYRMQASLVSRVTGQIYPLLLQLGEVHYQGRGHRYRLSDVTTRDGREYSAVASTPSTAVWNAARQMTRRNEYGRGFIAFRLPAEAPFSPREMTLPNIPGPTAIVERRLNDLAMVLTAAALFVPGVGQVAAVLGASLAAYRLIDRWQRDALRFDAATVGDLISVLGAAAQGVALIGRVRVVRAANRFALVRQEADAARIASALARAESIQRAGVIANQVADWGGFVWGNLTTLNQILEINQLEMQGQVTHAEARRRRASLMAGALRDGSLQILGATRTSRRAPPERMPPEWPAQRAEPPPTAPPVRTTEPGGEGPTRPPAEPPVAAPPIPAPAETVPVVPRRRAAPGEGAQPQVGAVEHTRPLVEEGRGRRPRPPMPEAGRVLAGEERVSGIRVPTPDGLHHILILDDGRIIRCSNQCAQIRHHYEDFLREQRESGEARTFDDRLSRLEQDSVANARAIEANQRALDENTDPHQRDRLEQTRTALEAERSQIGEDAGRLDRDIRQFAVETLSQELGGRTEGLSTLLEILTPEQTRQMHGRLGPSLFTHLAGRRDPNVIRQFVRAMQSMQGDTAAENSLIHTLDLTRRGISEVHFGEALVQLNTFLDQYAGRVSGDFMSRFARAVQTRGDPAQARAEIELARDILEGRTQIGTQLSVEGIPESRIPGQRTPEYQITGAGGRQLLAEVKFSVPRTRAIRRNLRSALGQIIGESRRRHGGQDNYIRIDARGERAGPELTPDSILRAVNGELCTSRTSVAGERLPEGESIRGLDYVEWVEVIYLDNDNNLQHRRYQVRNGVLVDVTEE